MNYINETKLAGTVDRIRPISTKTGATMCEVILKIRQDRFRVTAFKNVAESILSRISAGDRLSVTGTLSPSSWKDESTGEWRNSFAVQAWAVEIDGEKITYQREERQGEPANRDKEAFTAQDGDPF
ncbi:OB-fold nucleic acid binding domain-containing protein [uncultured Desulfobulbus sp.]|uniref:OB-fold nucleic acid binding domain-containing protein n=1 Tax=uncultured Desulfobulbus sp. TaxID=239745 RepID=UPI0029C6D8C4|nr:OB-fold nucleic acid binding domain-containing protein [uncultured Desulfobulbus sp.]